MLGTDLCPACLWAIEDPSDPTLSDGRGGSPAEPDTGVTLGLVETSGPPQDESTLPPLLDRYRPERVLGKGGFGKVILAEDRVLKRHVAIKILSHAASDPAAAAAFLNEARLLARMDHPGIMPVFDAVEIENGRFCIVSRFIDGPSLAQVIHREALSRHEAAAIMAAVGEALDHAHRQGVVHLDVKPANIIIAKGKRPVLLDFGIARLWQSFSRSDRIAGTPAYMSPEQARGEDHLLDGRSDIFSAGSVFYEMLTGQRAWDASTVAELVRRVSNGDLIPPRRIDPAIPREMERICLKAMQLRPKERYATAADFALELREWMAAESATLVTPTAPSASGVLSATPGTTTPGGILVRGLRCYDESDADFFLDLLPGPRDRGGLPDSVRTWKERLESTNEDTPRVCVLYGPSGSGKSSFLRAALIPRLARHVQIIRTDASDPNLSERLVQALRNRFPMDGEPDEPKALLQSLRQRARLAPGQKLVIVIDQIEQWLQASADRRPDLPAILRQCDGARIQALLVVRDDFWRGLTVLLDDAGTAITPDNSAMLDLFDVRHAAHVLELSGRAMGTLPSDSAVALPAAAAEFVRYAVAGLADHGQVSPARLALFTQMFRSRPWSLAALKDIGGVRRLGAAFLEDSFAGPRAPAPRRLHERAARNVLSVMLPETGEVRGPATPESVLREHSGYQDRPRLFSELLQMLDKDLRLLMPVETDEGSGEARAWQLTHDQLVPALRDWLWTRERASLRGRARIQLRERAAEYRLHANSRTAPGLSEWVRLRFLTSAGRWTQVEAMFMQKGRRRVLISLGVAAAVAAFGWAGVAEVRRIERAQSAAAAIKSAPSADVVRIARQSLALKDRLVPILEDHSDRVGGDSRSAGIALLALGSGDPSRIGQQMLEVSPPEFAAARDAFRLSGAQPPVARWTDALADRAASPEVRIRAMAALAALAPEALPASFESDVAAWLMLTGSEAPVWASYMRPVAHAFDPGLKALINGTTQKARVREACAALAALHSDDPSALGALVSVFPPEHLGMLRESLAAMGSTGVAALRERLETTPPVTPTALPATAEEESIYLSRAHAATLLAALGAPFEVGGFTLQRSRDQTERTLFTLAAVHAGVAASGLVTRLRQEPSAGVRFALLLALASYSPGDLPEHELDRFRDWLRSAWLTDSDGGCHSAIMWLARQWLLTDLVRSLGESTPRLESPQPGFSWWLTPSGVDMRIVTLASGERTALAATEFGDEAGARDGGHHKNNTWYTAATHCSKQSLQEDIPQSDWVYTPMDQGIEVSPPALSLRSYRLPTEAEWRAARGEGGATILAAGAFPEFLHHESWLYTNSDDRPHPPAELRPNDGGFFDIVGNAEEWLHEISDGQLGRLAGRDYTDKLDTVLSEAIRDYATSAPPKLIPGVIRFRLARTLLR
ncbi:MAG: protein kinase domain-containing protein [Verrucomicrobiales bacterium]